MKKSNLSPFFSLFLSGGWDILPFQPGGGGFPHISFEIPGKDELIAEGKMICALFNGSAASQKVKGSIHNKPVDQSLWGHIDPSGKVPRKVFSGFMVKIGQI